MKSIKKILFTIIFISIFLCLCSLTNNVQAAVKEDTSTFSSDTYIIGSTKFDEGFVITASRAAIAGANEAYMRYLMSGGFEFDTSDIKTYYYCEFDGTWSEVNIENGTLTELSEEETENLEENLNIYYVNNQEKTVEVPFEGTVDNGTVEGTGNGEAKFENGKIIIPASWVVNGFTFESNGKTVDVTLSDSSNGAELEEPVINVYNYVAEVNSIKYEDINAAFNAAENSTVTLLKDIDLSTGVEVSTKVTLELNNCTVTAKNDTEGKGLFTVVAGGDLTINGEGTLNSACQTNDYSMAIWVKETGKLTINGGTYTNKGAKAYEDDAKTPNNNDLIYARDNGTIVINAGTFIGNTENEKHGAKYTLNIKDKSEATITVYGGTFTEYNPAESNSENPKANFVADGYKVTVKDNKYTVTKIEENDVAIVKGMAYTSLQDALDVATNSTVTLLKDITITSDIEVEKELNLDLNEKTITIQGNDTRITAKGTANLTILNGTITSKGYGALRVTNSATLNIKDDVIINAVWYGITARENSTVNCCGIINISSDGYGITGNGNDTETSTTINVTGGKINAPEGHALYLPQNGITTITAGELSGKTAIAIKSGTLNIAGGIFKANGAKVEFPNPTYNGEDPTGDAIFVELNDEYKGNVVINYTSGTITSENAYVLREYSTNGNHSTITGLTESGGDGDNITFYNISE